MKVEQPKAEYQPVTITLETAEEREWFLSLCRLCQSLPNTCRSAKQPIYELRN